MSEDDKQSTFREAKILEVLNHPNIIRFKEVYKTKQGQLCIVMDYADGKYKQLSQNGVSESKNIIEFMFCNLGGDMALKIQDL